MGRPVLLPLYVLSPKKNSYWFVGDFLLSATTARYRCFLQTRACSALPLSRDGMAHVSVLLYIFKVHKMVCNNKSNPSRVHSQRTMPTTWATASLCLQSSCVHFTLSPVCIYFFLTFSFLIGKLLF